MDDAESRIFQDTLAPAAQAVGVPLTHVLRSTSALRYATHLLVYNQHTNLTRITDPAEIAIKHFADSLTVLRSLPEFE